MSKRNNISYIKPEEPSFLKKLKEQAGYKEGPTVDTKREDFGPADDEDFLDTEEEQPTVVVLKTGDLTAEEATREQKRLEKEEEKKVADLTQPIVFKSKKEKQVGPENKPAKRSSEESKQKSKKAKTKSVLSFDEEEFDE